MLFTISAQTALGAQNTLSDYTVQLVNQWQNITAVYTSNLFSGSSSTTPNITDLTNLMANGSLLNNGVGAQDIYDMQSILAETLFGLLIPKAWQTSNEDVNPFILYAVLPLPQNPSKPLHPASPKTTPQAAPKIPGQNGCPTPPPPPPPSATTTNPTTSSTSRAGPAPSPTQNPNVTPKAPAKSLPQSFPVLTKRFPNSPASAPWMARNGVVLRAMIW